MRSVLLPPRFLVGCGLALLIQCARVEAAEPLSSWVVKITPVYSNGALDRVEIRYQGWNQPFVLKSGQVGGQTYRPMIQVDPSGDQAWLGLDGDLAWEGRCSVAGQWLVIDADRSGPGLDTANLRYNLRTRRVFITSGDSELVIDLNDGGLSGSTRLAGACKNLRDHYLNQGNVPFRVTVSDGAEHRGVVWVFPDLVSVGVGPSDKGWFSESVPWPASENAGSLAECVGVSANSGSASGRGAGSGSVRDERRVADLSAPAESPPEAEGDFGEATFKPVCLVPAPSVRPVPLSAWPGKELPRLPECVITSDDSQAGGTVMDKVCRYWCLQGRWVSQLHEVVSKAAGESGVPGPEERAVEETVGAVGRSCDWITGGTSATDRGMEMGRFLDALRRLDERQGLLVGECRRAMERARGLSQQVSNMAEAVATYRDLPIGSGLNDEVWYLLTDVAAQAGPLPTRRELGVLIAQRMLCRLRADLLAEMWTRQHALHAVAGGSDPEHSQNRLRLEPDRQWLVPERLDAASDRTVAMLASAIYTDAPAMATFRQHMSRRIPDGLSAAPAEVARVVEDLAGGDIAAPSGLEQLLIACRAIRQERVGLLSEAGVKAAALRRLTEQAGHRLEDAIRQRSRSVADLEKVRNDRRLAIAGQTRQVADLVRWVCWTYADQIFGRPDLTPRQRKALVLSTAAWWVRQWGMDLCWVAVDFDIDIRRQDKAYAWGVRSLRVRLLDQPDPEALAEERMARTPPAQEFPLGPMQLSDGRVAYVRTAMELGAPILTAGGDSSGRLGKAGPDLDARLILPQRDRGSTTTRPSVAAQTSARSSRVGPPSRDTAEAIGPPPMVRKTPAAPAAPSVRELAETAEHIDPPVQGDELTIPVMLRADEIRPPRRLSVRPGQLVTLMGMVRFDRPAKRPVRVCVDLKAGDPAAEALDMILSPPARGSGKPTMADLPSGRWLRRTIQWDSMVEPSESFTLQFRAPAGAKWNRLTMAIVLAWDVDGRTVGLAEQTYVFHSVEPLRAGGLLASDTE